MRCLTETVREKLLSMDEFQQNMKHSYLHLKISCSGKTTKYAITQTGLSANAISTRASLVHKQKNALHFCI